jgi:hypothetical protein
MHGELCYFDVDVMKTPNCFSARIFLYLFSTVVLQQDNVNVLGQHGQFTRTCSED